MKSKDEFIEIEPNLKEVVKCMITLEDGGSSKFNGHFTVQYKTEGKPHSEQDHFRNGEEFIEKAINILQNIPNAAAALIEKYNLNVGATIEEHAEALLAITKKERVGTAKRDKINEIVSLVNMNEENQLHGFYYSPRTMTLSDESQKAYDALNVLIKKPEGETLTKSISFNSSKELNIIITNILEGVDPEKSRKFFEKSELDPNASTKTNAGYITSGVMDKMDSKAILLR